MSNLDLFAALAPAPTPEPAPTPVAAPAEGLAGKRLYLVDGSGFIFRAYHSLPPLTRADGTPVGAVMGFMNMMLKLVDAHTSDYFAVIFDAGRTTFRNRMYDQYKANRSAPPDDLIPQFPLVREATRALNLPALEIPDYEADDLIATYTRLGREAGMEVVIVSSDKDLMQLIDDGVWLFDAMKNRELRAPDVVEKFGVGPEKLADVLALMGDTSDNIPGVPGIGPKTAAELITQFGNLEALLASLNQIKQPKRRDVLTEHAENARLSRRLVALDAHVPPPLPIEELAFKSPEPEQLLNFVRTQGFRALITRLSEKYGMASSSGAMDQAKPSRALETPNAGGNPAPNAEPSQEPAHIVVDRSAYKLVTDLDQLHALLKRATAQGHFAIDTETTASDSMRADLVGVALALAPGEAFYVPLSHVDEAGHRVTGQIPFDGALALLAPVLADPAVLKIGHNIKYDLVVLQRLGLTVAPIADTTVLSYALYAGYHPHSMDFLAERYLRHLTISFTDVTGKGKSAVTFDRVPLEAALTYAAEDADVTLRLYHLLWARLVEQKLLRVYELDAKIVPILSRMEMAGIAVDRAALAALSSVLSAKAATLEAEIHTLAGHPFAIGSPKQLGEVLFGELGLPGAKKSAKTGQYSTDALLLEELSDAGHELPAKVLEWRQATKLINTYTESLPLQINPSTDRIHTSFNITGAATGRLSSSEPNLQNIPIRTEEGRRIRDAFVAAPGKQLLSADYSQIELRLLAHVAEMPSLKQAFLEGRDIHATTAAEMFGGDPASISGDLRRKAKTINFGIIYGISAHGLAVRLQISRQEAGAYIARYFEQYPGIRDYMESKKEEARKYGYVTTLHGRRIHIPAINERNPARRQGAERQAINAPLQGSAADIIKRAMVALDPLLNEHAKLLLQVHDELVFEVTPEHAEAMRALIKKEMERAAHLSVPLVVETGLGTHWGEAH